MDLTVWNVIKIQLDGTSPPDGEKWLKILTKSKRMKLQT